MATSVLRLKVAAASTLSVFRSHGSNLGFQGIRGYSIVAGRGTSRPDPKQADDKAAAGHRQRSWMPDPVTGYYLPEDHLGERTDITERNENTLKIHSTTSGVVPK
nr:late embryogenesis abundant protein LEA86 [Pinus tabuliformis]